MIAKRIAKKPDVKDNFAALAYYIAAAGDDGEKLDRLWIAGCDAGGDAADLDAAVAEVESTRRLGPAVDNKTYHLIVSFRPGDREKLSAADLAAVEATFAEALGFAGHQRVVGTHVNTDNFHMHAAYNKVHPETLKVHTPYKDFFTLSTVCRQLEKKYGLTVDRGMEARGANALGPGARDYEAETWQESFQTHLLGHKQEIVRRALAAATWPALHAALADYDAGIVRRGAGLALMGPNGEPMKASALDRSLAKARLEARLGAFQESWTG